MRHRIGLALTGTALLCLGGLGLVLASAAGGRPVLDPWLSRYAARTDGFWPVVGVGCWAVTLLGCVWLAAQIRTALARRVALVDSTTRMLTRAAARGLTGDIKGLPGVRDVTVRFTGIAEDHCVQLLVVCDEAADLGQLRTRIADGPLARFRHLVDMEEIPAIVRFRLCYRKQCLA
jgi:hypothetical protein